MQDLRGEAAAGEATRRASAARWARSSRSRPTASPSSAPTAASRSLRVQARRRHQVAAGEWATSAKRGQSSLRQLGTTRNRHGFRPTPHAASRPSRPIPTCRLATRQSRNPTSKSRRPPRAAHPRDRAGKARHCRGDLEPYGHYKAKVSMRLHQVARGPAERQAHSRHRDHPDAGGRRQDHHHGRPHRRAQPYRQESDDVPARALAWALASG